MSDGKEQSGSDKRTAGIESNEPAGIVSRVRRILTNEALRNLVAIAALLVAAISLNVSLKQAERSREVDRRIQNRELLAVQLSADLIESEQATAEWPARDYSPFEPPYLTVPVRLFIMNRTSLPQSIKGVWVSFDDDRPENQLRYVTINRIEETDGAKVRWPKTIPPGAADGMNLRVSIPIEAATAGKLGIDENKLKSRDVGPAGSLHFVFDETLDRELPLSLRRPIHFNLRLLSPSPEAPSNLHFQWSPPW